MFPSKFPSRKIVLYEAVFKAVVRHHHDASSGPEHFNRLQEELLEGLQFIIDFYSQGLVDLGEVLMVFHFFGMSGDRTFVQLSGRS